MKQERLKLGVPFDLLFDRYENRLYDLENAIKEKQIGYALNGGLKLPGDSYPGTGNIVIRGRPGTAKSILAMQLAYQCCMMNENVYSWFMALEDTPDNVCAKADSFGWKENFFPIRFLSEAEDIFNPADYAHILSRILSVKSRDDCSIHRQTLRTGTNACGESSHEKPFGKRVYLSCLSPRHLLPVDNEAADIYEERYKQMERLLWAAESLTTETGNRLGMVCIDSLNVFGDRLLNREQIHRLFSLFTRHKVLGVFILEEDEGQVLSPDSRLHGDVIEFLADVIIAMQSSEDAGYYTRYFEIVKSRYQHQIYGKHPFKIKREDKNVRTQDNSSRPIDNPNYPVKTGVVIYPSLHYIVYGTGTKPDTEGPK